MKDVKEMRDKAFILADDIINETGPRLAGSDASNKSAKILEESMSDFCDETSLDEFKIHQGAFLGWIKILVLAYIISLILLFYNLPIFSLLVSIGSLLILILQFFFYLPIIDFLYPKKTSTNVMGMIEPKEDIKQQVIISGHHDSARIFNFFIHQPKLYNIRVTGSIGFVIILTLVSLIRLFVSNDLFILISNILLALGSLLIIQMWFFASKKGTPGAGDNLIASTMALEIGRYYSQNKLKHTRIIIASFDAEEEGLRGSRAFAKKYKGLLDEYPTTLLNSDCLYYKNEMFFLTSDINGTVKLDKELAKELTDIANNNNYEATYKPIAFLTGGTDAGELAKVGVKATSLIAMPWSNQARSSVYHTPNDTLDKIEKEVIDAAITIFTHYIEKHDH